MKLHTHNFYRLLIVAAMVVPGASYSAQAPNPRATTIAHTVASAARSDASNTQSARTTSRRTQNTMSRTAANVSARGGRASVSRNATTTNRPTTTAARSGVLRISRSAIKSPASVSRAATTSPGRAGMSRAANVARATAVFNDISKIGGGYSQCRESYATCMDQFCANANDTYRRCYCSERFTGFRDTENALDQAKVLLQQFEDNNLNAVNMTAAEVNAMYTATVGEAAIKRDTSAAQSVLDQIGDLLSGKTKVATQNTSGSLGILSLDFSSDMDDIWGGGNDLFGGSSATDMSKMEGEELYNASLKQCSQLVSDSCTSDAVFNMAKSSYSILITQDCNAYEKKIDTQREAVAATVRTAEKYLREARLEEYRSHNSADVNECLDRVRTALTQDTACGANYKRCLDYTGAYIDQSTGDPIYTPRLFELNNLILLTGASGNGDVLSQNPQFNRFLDSRRMFASSALDSCRDIADTVWSEFKRAALIEIAQAQDAKIEEVKMSCVSTMKDCYDTQSGALKDFDDTTSQYSGATAAYAAKQMCQDKVIACASLYGDTNGCKFDGNGVLTAGSNVASNGTPRCGLTALLKFVDSVDNVRVAEGCETAIESYLKELCTPSSGDMGYPWNCRNKDAGDPYGTDAKNDANASVAENVRYFAVENCSDPSKSGQEYTNLDSSTQSKIQKVIGDMQEELEYQLETVCENLDGFWVGKDIEGKPLNAFYTSVFGGRQGAPETSWGKCLENSTMVQCISYNTDGEKDGDMARYDAARDECIFTDKWYEQQCSLLGNGYFENGVCYVSPEI